MLPEPLTQPSVVKLRPCACSGDESFELDVDRQYTALTVGVALVDRSDMGRLLLVGEDALDLLQRLSTNDLKSLQPGTGVATILTSNKGRIVDLLVVICLGDDSCIPGVSHDSGKEGTRFLVLTASDNRRKVTEWIEFYTFVEDIQTYDVTEETAVLSLVGPKAVSVLARNAGTNPVNTDRFGSIQTEVCGVDVIVLRTDFAGVPSFDLIVSLPDLPRLKRGLLEQGKADGIEPAGAEAVDVVRIERGIPVSGKELTEDFNPLEAGLFEHVSFTKGCYVGQEVVTRLNTYNKVSKYLVGLRWGRDVPVSQGTSLFDDGKQVGVVTSAGTLPTADGVGLGYVRKAQGGDGYTLSIDPKGSDTQIEVVGFTPQISR